MIESFGLSKVPYETHPAFSGIRFDEDPAIKEATDRLSHALEEIRRRSVLPSTNVKYLLEERVGPALQELFGKLRDKNSDIDIFSDFADRLKSEMIKLITEDYDIFARRGTYSYAECTQKADLISESLFKKGFFIGRYSLESVGILESAVIAEKNMLSENYKFGKRNREDLSVNLWKPSQESLLNSVFGAKDICDGLSNYMGSDYVYSGCAFELSMPNLDWWKNRYQRDDESEPSAYYHLDMNSPYPKMLCYLSAVTEKNGATSLLDASLDDSTLSWIAGRALDKVREDPNRGGTIDMTSLITGTELGRICFSRLPKEMRCIGHFGNDILKNSNEEAFILKNQKVMTGEPGTFAVFDGTRVAHRGGIVHEGSRWAFQAIYRRK